MIELTLKYNIGSLLSGSKITSTRIDGDKVWFFRADGFEVYLEKHHFIWPQPTDKPEFKLGKYTIEGLGIVEALAFNDGWAWCKSEIGGYYTFNVDRLKSIAKFDHLRGMAVDAKVVVWNGQKRFNRHFSHLSIDGNNAYCFIAGKTSFTAGATLGGEQVIECWNNCEVWEEK